MSITVDATFFKQPTSTTPGVLGVRVLATDTSVEKTTEVAFLIDTSGSMEGDRLDSVKNTLKVVTQMLKVGDKITLCSFAQTATNVLSHFTITDTSEPALEPALSAIDRLIAQGGTNLDSGLFMLGNLYKNMTPPDALVILTDGHINEGITTFDGLNTILDTYFKSVPRYTLGYGGDHNAELLKQLAEVSRANYTFIQSEISLPITMGDLYGGLRSEVAANTELSYPLSWTCLEPLSMTQGKYPIGSLVANKEMWVMFTVPLTVETETTVNLYYKLKGSLEPSSPVQGSISERIPLASVEAQYLRCMTAKTLNMVTDFMKTRQLPKAEEALKAAIKLIEDSSVASDDFVVRMKAQLAETLAQTQQAIRVPVRAHFAIDDLYYRTTSVGGNFATQRGRTRMNDGTTPMLFSSQEQGIASVGMSECYSAIHARDPEPTSN